MTYRRADGNDEPQSEDQRSGHRVPHLSVGSVFSLFCPNPRQPLEGVEGVEARASTARLRLRPPEGRGPIGASAGSVFTEGSFNKDPRALLLMRYRVSSVINGVAGQVGANDSFI